MDFDLSEEQQIFVTSARRFLETECPKSLVSEAFEDEKGHVPDLWRKMAEMGWLGITLPGEFGGSGGSFLDLVLLAEEMGRALLPGPFLSGVVPAARTILSAGNQAQKKRHLQAIADGSAIFTLGPPEAGIGPDKSSIGLKAEPEGDGFIINGVLEFVPYAHVSDHIIFAARTGGGQASEEGITLFFADTGADGIRIEPLETITGDKPCRVAFSSAAVSKENILGSIDSGWPVLENTLSEAAVAESGWMVGGARWVLETAVEYAKQRVQFGVPIGSFQAIQHKCADMLTDVDGASFMTYYAAWAITENEPDKHSAASEAKAWCSDMYNRVADEGIQILGGIGFTLEHDMQLYYRRAKASETAFGDALHHREKLARMFGL
jgi:alkylation response protein AidB-like acyl-CoA dehydrogenase